MKLSAPSRVVWSTSLPIIFAGLSETIIHVTDTIFLARVGVVEAGAIALADTILEMCMVLTLGVVEGIQILVARRLGEGRVRAAGQTFNQGLLVLTAASLVLTSFVLQLAAPVSGMVVTSAQVGGAVADFLQIMAWGIAFTSANFAYSALFVGLGRTRVLVWATLVLAITNVGLDYVLVFGKLGFPALGIRGSAMGSLGAEIACFLFHTGYVLARIDVRHYGLFEFGSLDRRLIKALARLSYPIALKALLEGLRWLAFFLIVERLGEVALAQSNIVYACYALFRIPTEGFAETACSMVSKLIGEGKAEKIEHLVREVISDAYLVSLPFAGLAFLAPGIVLSCLASEGPLVSGGEASLRVVSLAMLVIIPAEMWFVTVSGTGDTAAAFGIETVLTAAMVACGYLTAFVLGLRLEYVWLSLPISWLACLSLSYAWVRAGYWRRVDI